jgi:hypothetical protein
MEKEILDIESRLYNKIEVNKTENSINQFNIEIFSAHVYLVGGIHG